MADKSHENLTFGFDIGIASVGWCVLGESRIVDLGVRCFDKAETDVKGESLNLARRTARLTRRRLRRRAWRLTKLARLLKREGLIANVDQLRQPSPDSPWHLRVAGLDRRLAADEWARVVYHLCKHRGFHWISKADKKKAENDKKEGGLVTKGLSDTERYMKELDTRSVAKMVLTKFPDAQRNKQGDYGKALSRVLLADEMVLLFQRQRELGNAHAGIELESQILGNGDQKSGLFWKQKPMQSVLSMLGRCTFERDGGPDGKGEYRAPKASFTAERHVWLTRLNNLRIVVDGTTRPLNDEERRAALPLPYEQAKDLSYQKLHDVLVKTGWLPESFEFAGLRPSKEGKDPKDQKLIGLPSWQELRLTLKRARLETEWQGMAGAATGGDPSLLDKIAEVLSIYKDGNEVEAELRKLNLPGGQPMIDALSEISFDKFHALSLKALRKIVPHMENGLRYDEAIAAIPEYGHHSQLHKSDDEKELYLPQLYEDARGKKPGEIGKMIFSERIERDITGGIPRNPIVLRAINQARKVMNALIHEYIWKRKHSLVAVHIELARDLSRPLDERRKIEKEQSEYRDRNEVVRRKFEQTFGFVPDGRTFERYQLYEEQLGQCAYSGQLLEIDQVVRDNKYAEVDHALPYRRSYDNSKNNKVLVHSRENQNKGNRTPFEYLCSFPDGENGERWRDFVRRVESNKNYRVAKKNRLLRKNFGEDEAREFRDRNLNDTRYICRFFKNYVERYLKFEAKVGADGTAAQTAKRCVVVSGGLTSLLRARWGLPTSKEKRAESDRHHAMDAAVIAACGHLVVQRTATMLNADGWGHRPDLGGYLNTETGEILTTQEFVRKDEVYKLLPRPWKHFRDELLARLSINDATELRSKMELLGTYPPEALERLRPVFISRAPQRRGGGLLHEATLRSPKRIDDGISHVKVKLEDLTMTKLDNVVGATYSRNHPLMSLLRERLEKFGGDGKKAFAEPVFKPSKSGKGSPVKSVKVASTQKSGLHVGSGVAEWGPMHHVDVYRHDGGYFIAPAYVLDIPKDRQIRPPEPPSGATFQFTLSKNDYVKITLGSIEHMGYFVMYENDGTRITLRAHDQTMPDRKYFRKAVTNAKLIQKFHVDVLGNIYPAPPEKRRGLA